MIPDSPRLKAIGAILAVAIFLTVAGWLLFRPTPRNIQGEVEATHVDIASKIPGRIDSLLVREGDSVIQGQLLVVLSSAEIQAKTDQARAAAGAARAQRNKAYTGAREEEIRAAEQVLERARAAAEFAETTFERMERLFSEGVLPTQRRDQAEAERDASRAAMEAAQAQYDMAIAGAREEDKNAASALVRQAEAAVSEAMSYLDETRLHSPIDGIVANRVMDRGELVASGYPIVTIVDLSDIWTVFNLREDRLGDIRMGSVFRGSVPALGNREIELAVSHISALGDYAAWRATSDAGGFDLRTFEVRARPVEPVEGLHPGMSVVVSWPPNS